MLTANCSVPMVLMIYHSDLFYFWSVDTCLCMLNWSKHTGDGHAWNTMLYMEVDSLRRRGGGVRTFGRGGVRGKGVWTNPPNPPPWLRACTLSFRHYNVAPM